MRYHKIRYIEISSPYPELLGHDMEISDPVDLFLDTEKYFLPVGCTKLGKINGHLAVELQKQ